jgi:hypothetical protein
VIGAYDRLTGNYDISDKNLAERKAPADPSTPFAALRSLRMTLSVLRTGTLSVLRTGTLSVLRTGVDVSQARERTPLLFAAGESVEATGY